MARIRKSVSVDDVMAWRPCGGYDRERVEALFGRRKRVRPLGILHLEEIPVTDRLWCLLREDFLSPAALRQFACDCASRALHRERKAGREPDERSRAAIRVARRFARGKATQEELAAARSAAWSAARSAAWSAGGSAAWSAARAAAWDASWSAAGSAARSAERVWQLRRLEKYLVAAGHTQ